jgi:hypothetical protein
MKHCAEVIFMSMISPKNNQSKTGKASKNIRELGKTNYKMCHKDGHHSKRKVGCFLKPHKGILTSIDDLKAELEKNEQSSSNTSIKFSIIN